MPAADSDLIAVALAAGKSVAEAATAGGVSDRTVYRRLTDPAFKARVAELRAGMVDAAAGRLSEAMAGAALVLRNLMVTGAEEAVRLRAAAKLIELGLRVRDQVEIEARVRALEEKALVPPPTGAADGGAGANLAAGAAGADGSAGDG